MKFIFPSVVIPAGFAGPDLVEESTFIRLYEFREPYRIEIGDNRHIDDDNLLVVAAPESVVFLKKLLRDEKIHALNVFEPLIFGMRKDNDVIISEFNSTLLSDQSAVIETLSCNEVSNHIENIELYLRNILFKHYPNILSHVLVLGA